MRAELERPFDEPWQARIFALTVNLHEQGMFSWREWTDELGTSLAAAPERAYYESWIEALQSLLATRGAVAEEEIADVQRAWLAAAARTPHGKPIELEPPG